MEELQKSGASIIHVSPEHHYPLGISMTEKRKQELLDWESERPDRYILEDDYDCEFRYRSQMNQTLQSMDRHHRVIYLNTFGKTLAPGIRISYMVLLEASEKLPIIKITGGESGTHLLVKLDTELTDMQIRWAARQRGIGVSCLSQYCSVSEEKYAKILVMTYSNVDPDVLEEAVRRLEEIF